MTMKKNERSPERAAGKGEIQVSRDEVTGDREGQKRRKGLVMKWIRAGINR